MYPSFAYQPYHDAFVEARAQGRQPACQPIRDERGDITAVRVGDRVAAEPLDLLGKSQRWLDHFRLIVAQLKEQAKVISEQADTVVIADPALLYAMESVIPAQGRSLFTSRSAAVDHRVLSATSPEARLRESKDFVAALEAICLQIARQSQDAPRVPAPNGKNPEQRQHPAPAVKPPLRGKTPAGSIGSCEDWTHGMLT